MKRGGSGIRGYVMLVVTGGLLILLVDYLGLLEGLNRSMYDLSFRIRGSEQISGRIVIAAVDEKTLARLGPWPMRRIHYAALLDRVKEAQVVGFDVPMGGPSEDDTLFARAIGNHGKVVLPAYVDHILHIVSPPPLLSANATGHLHLEPGVDGIVRAAFHTISLHGVVMFSFSSAVYETYSGNIFPRTPIPTVKKGEGALAGISQRDPVKINFYGGPWTFPAIPLVDIIDGRYPSAFFRGKIVLVGLTAVGTGNRLLVPFTENRDSMAGVEVHANLVNNLLDHNAIKEVHGWLKWGLLAALSFLTLLWFRRMSQKKVLLAWFSIVVFVSICVLALFWFLNLWLSPAIFYLSATYLFIGTYMLKLEEMGKLLLDAKEEWENTFDTIDEAISIHGTDGSILRMNESARQLLGPDVQGILTERVREECQKALSKEIVSIDAPITEWADRESGELFDPQTEKSLKVKTLPRMDRTNKLVGMVCVASDVTEKKKLEEYRQRLQAQLMQTQKTEVIGRLAGGIAHDFNNILTAILGYSEMGLMCLTGNETVRGYLKTIQEAGQKAGALTKQLLAFSRKQVMDMEPLNLTEMVEGMAKILHRLIGEDVILTLKMEGALNPVLADRGQMEQVLMNLVVNARDALPEGGSLVIETANGGPDIAHRLSDDESGQTAYVVLSVTDTGIGMTPQIQEKIFDPFFTTKEVGKGTGLGLSTVYGVVMQHKGHIDVESTPGKGTTFRVYLPATTVSIGETSEIYAAPAAVEGTETILLVEDDPSTRALLKAILKPLGYRVLEASNGDEALQRSATFEGCIHVLLTDVIMPGMNGKELADRVRSARPETRVIFVSGYTDDVIAHHGVLEPGVVLIQKPLTAAILVTRLREVLDR